MTQPFITPKTPPPTPSPEEQRAADLRRLEEVRAQIAKRRAELEWEAVKQTLSHNPVNPIGPKHQDHAPREKKEVVPFDPFAPREVGTVDWSAQEKARDQQRTEGRRKPKSGKKGGSK